MKIWARERVGNRLKTDRQEELVLLSFGIVV